MVWWGTDIQFSEVIVVTTTFRSASVYPFLTRLAKLNFALCADDRMTKTGESLLASKKIIQGIFSDLLEYFTLRIFRLGKQFFFCFFMV